MTNNTAPSQYRYLDRFRAAQGASQKTSQPTIVENDVESFDIKVSRPRSAAGDDLGLWLIGIRATLNDGRHAHAEADVAGHTFDSVVAGVASAYESLHDSAKDSLALPEHTPGLGFELLIQALEKFGHDKALNKCDLATLVSHEYVPDVPQAVSLKAYVDSKWIPTASMTPEERARFLTP